VLSVHNISKKFAGVQALNNVSLDLYPGQVNAIIGENGAGKSTLMKILSGVLRDYTGDILCDGKPVRFENVKSAEEVGITIIHQELNLVPDLSICENIFLGKELLNRWGLLDEEAMNTQAKNLLERLHIHAKPGTKVSLLKTGEQQLVEIARALLVNAKTIIMDEPTSAISDREVETLFKIIRQLRSEGKTIVYISHKLKELFEIADRYIVIRDGKTIDSGVMKDVTPDELVNKMVGRELSVNTHSQEINGQPEIFKLQNICLSPSIMANRKSLDNICLTLHKGEIIGIYGLMGSGRSELMETIFGLHKGRSTGEIYVNGKLACIKEPSHAVSAGIALVPEDRKRQGLILDQNIKKNISITVLEQLQKWGFMINSGKEKTLSKRYVDQLAIKTASDNNKAASLSGGNQQKIVLAKWLATNPVVLLLDEPTRGIDINAKYDIYKLMRQLAAGGMGIIMISSELPEILSVSDRILVMAEGKLTADLPILEATENNILKFAIHKND
jgi:ribose transport system ATP-binding protein